MGWSAMLVNPTLDPEADITSVGEWWNYTHNVAPMIYAAGVYIPADLSWWQHLNGMTGEHGAVFLGRLVQKLEADPKKFRPMYQGDWGSYDGLLVQLRGMAAESRENPNAEWWASG